MTKRIIFATGNQNKMREIREIMDGTGYEILSMKEADVFADPEENGSTFAENALIKARAVAEKVLARGEDQNVTETIILADDSGLEVDYLDRQPGIYSARFMGHETPYSEKNKAILEKLSGVPKEKRTARFVCAIAAVILDGSDGADNGDGSDGDGGGTKTSRELTTTQTMEGYIAEEIAGENGFGYDPVFWLEEYGCTSAEISPEEKNAISHRGKALRKMKEMLCEF